MARSSVSPRCCSVTCACVKAIEKARDAALPSADLVLANLTGAVLLQNAALLRSAVAPGGTLIVSGLQTHERADVLAAFAGATVQRQDDELDWVALTFTF